jgi:dTDP-4-amino-4,6-dideoxygalactose transaminase
MVVGGNFRLDAIQAAVLRAKLKYLDEWTKKRQMNAAYYRQLFSQVELPISLPCDVPHCRHIYNQFVIRTQDRDKLMTYLKSRQVGSEVYYPVSMHMQECFADLDYHFSDFTESEQAAQETLALPIYPELTPEQQAVVVKSTHKFYE